MKNFIIAATLAACSLNVMAAQPEETYECDGQVVNMKTNEQGVIVMDMATIERFGKDYRVTVQNADDGISAQSNFTQKTRTPRIMNGVTYFFIHDETKTNLFDFVELEGNTALVYITDTTGKENQLQLQCKLK